MGILARLSGFKTYLAAFLMIVLAGLKAQGYITDDAYAAVMAVLLPLGIVALRAGVTKSGPTTPNT